MQAAAKAHLDRQAVGASATRRRRLALGTKLAVAAAVVTLGAMALLTLVFTRTLRHDFEQSLADQQRALASQAAAALDDALAERLDVLRRLALLLPAPALEGSDGLRAFLASRTPALGLFDDVTVIDRAGTVIAQQPGIPGRLGDNFAERDYFKQALTTRRAYIAKPLLGRHLGVPLVVMSAPVLDGDGAVIAVLAGIIKLDRPNFLGRLAGARIGAGGYFYLVHRDGTVIMHPDKSRVMQPLPVDHLAGAPGRDGFLTYKSLTQTDWILASVVPVEEAFAPLRRLQGTALAVGALAALASALVIGGLIRSLAGRLSTLHRQVDAARRKPPAEAAATIALRGEDEAGDLADAIRAALTTAAAERARLQDFTEAASDWMWETGPDHRFRAVTYTREAGMIPAPEIMGSARWELPGAVPRDGDWAEHRAVLQAHRPFKDFRYVTLGTDGKPHHTRISGRPIFDAAGRFAGYRGVGREETSEVEAEARAADAAALLAKAFQSMSESMILLDPEQRILAWNQRFEADCGRAAVDVLARGRSFEELLRQAAARGVYAIADNEVDGFVAGWLERLRQPSAVQEIELASRAWLQVRTARTDDGGAVVVMADVTELKRRQAELRTLSAAVEQSASIVVVTGIDGRIRYVNRKFTEVTGYAFREAVGSTPAMLQSGTTPRETYAELWHTLLSGRHWIGEIRNRRKNGELYWCSETISPLRDEQGRITHFVAVEQDVTERRRVEEELLQAKERAEFANRAKTEFLANMSHELRTPLNAVIGFAEVMREELFGEVGNDRYKGYVEDIHQSGVHLLAVINDILDLSKVEAARIELQEDEYGLAELASAAVRLIAARAAQGGVAVVEAVDPALPALWCDGRLLKQVLLNLLSNAVKFTAAGGEVRLWAAATSDGGVAIGVTDTGIGIAEPYRLKVFEPFFQVEGSYARKHAGTGLGLSLSKALVELHGGSIELESRLGSGTTVTVRLPAARLRRPRGGA